MSKETFIIRTEWYEAIAELEPTDQATIFRNLFLYHLGDTDDMVLDTLGVKLVWKLIEPTLSRNIDAYKDKVQTNRENGKLGGRPPKAVPTTEIKTQINPNNQTVIAPITQTETKTLSDSDSVSDYVSDSDSEDDTSAPEKIKNFSELILLPPGDPANQFFYETEICMPLNFTMDEVKLIHTAWAGDRIGQVFTLRDARTNFKGYASKWRMNQQSRGNPKNGTKKEVVKSDYL